MAHSKSHRRIQAFAAPSSVIRPISDDQSLPEHVTIEGRSFAPGVGWKFASPADLLAQIQCPEGRSAIDVLQPSAANWLTMAEGLYNETKETALVFEAMHVAFCFRLPFPHWVMAYLARVATKFHDMSSSNIPQGRIAPAVYRALEFDPPPPVRRHAETRRAREQRNKKYNPFRIMRDETHDFGVVCEMLLQYQMDPNPKDLKRVTAEDAVIASHPTRCRKPTCRGLSRRTIDRILARYDVQFVRADPCSQPAKQSV
jgi:hypothetical protein